MASSSISTDDGHFDSALEYATKVMGIESSKLKDGQKKAIYSFMAKKDTLVVLPTGYGKSLIYQLAPLCCNFIQHANKCSCSTALMSDQVKRLATQGIDAISAAATKSAEEKTKLSKGKYSIVFATPESLLKTGTGLLHSSLYRENVCGVFVDEGHCVAKWGFKDGKVAAFRQKYSRIAELRSLLKSSTPMCCLTATASPMVKTVIVSSLGLTTFTTVKESPERPNIRYSVVDVDEEIDDQFKWLQEELLSKGVDIPKLLIFCKLKKNCSLVHACLTANNTSIEPFVRIFHADSPPSSKAEILDDFTKKNSTIRVLLATSAFGMGVNVPALHTVLNYGPSRDVDDYFQESGRVGRDGQQSHAVIMNFKGRGKGVVKPAMKAYVKNANKSCRRQELLAYYGENVNTKVCPHNCCDSCSFTCECGEDGICVLGGGAGWVEHALADQQRNKEIIHKYARNVTSDEQGIIRGLLLEYQQSLTNHEGEAGLYTGTSIASAFPSQLINLVCAELHTIGGIEDLSTRFPFFNLGHARKVWVIIDQICESPVQEIDQVHQASGSSTDEDSFCLSDLDSDDAELQQKIINSQYHRINLPVYSDGSSTED